MAEPLADQALQKVGEPQPKAFERLTAFDESDGRGKERMDEFVRLFASYADALTPSSAPACARLRADSPARRQVAAAEKRRAFCLRQSGVKDLGGDSADGFVLPGSSIALSSAGCACYAEAAL